MRLHYTNAFKKDYKLSAKRGDDIEKVDETITCLAEGVPLPKRYKDHELTGQWLGVRECHIKPDLLLLYIRAETDLTLIRLGAHTDLFD